MSTDSIPSILAQIARTALLVAVLGGLIYAGAVWLAEMPGAEWWLAMALAMPLALLCAAHLTSAVRAGVLPYGRASVVRRDERPRLFWGLVAYEAAMAALLAAIGVWALLQVTQV